MALVVRCAKCAQAMQVPDDAVGKQVRCPSCKAVFAIAAASARPPAVVGATSPASATTSPAPSAVRPPIASSLSDPSMILPPECPACKAAILPGAVACIECGYLLQPDAAADSSDGPPVLCTNPACGVANPPKERNCQRCSTPLPTAPGTMLHGRYRIDRLLAIGGFGAVYLATDTKSNNRQVAIKDMICADQQEFTIRLNFFRREAEILRSLASVPIVPRFFDFIEQGQQALLVMEYIRGNDLLKLMENSGNKPFPLDRVIEWGKSMCDVLTHMHSQTPAVIHRDLKPENIMLLEDQQSIKMIDFGTARDLGRTQKDRQVAKTRVYTEGYAPPEQIVGKPEARSDLFALAGTLYHLASGKAPEGFYTSRELEGQLNGGNGPPPAQHRWFFELIKINLSEDANDRYFSAREFRADLEQQRVTKEIACPRCQTENKVREPYCSKCAEPLTDPTPPCNHCGKPNRMGSRCCIHCGNRLR